MPVCLSADMRSIKKHRPYNVWSRKPGVLEYLDVNMRSQNEVSTSTNLSTAPSLSVSLSALKLNVQRLVHG